MAFCFRTDTLVSTVFPLTLSFSVHFHHLGLCFWPSLPSSVVSNVCFTNSAQSSCDDSSLRQVIFSRPFVGKLFRYGKSQNFPWPTAVGCPCTQDIACICWMRYTENRGASGCQMHSLVSLPSYFRKALIQQTPPGSLGSNWTLRTPAISNTMGQHWELSSESQTEFKRNLHFSLVLRPAAEHLLQQSPLHLCYSLWVALPSTRNWERADSSEFAESGVCSFVCHSASACRFFFFLIFINKTGNVEFMTLS